MELLVSLALGLAVWFLLPGERPSLVERASRVETPRVADDSGIYEREDERSPSVAPDRES